MISLADISPIPIELIKEMAEQAPVDEAPAQSTKQKARSASSRPSSHENTLGKMDVERYLTHYGWFHSRKAGPSGSELFNLVRCVFDESHTKKEAAVIQWSSGLLTYQCHHDSCKGNPQRTFPEARKIISGSDDLSQFHEGYDPNWKPPVKRGRKKKSDQGAAGKSSEGAAPPDPVEPEDLAAIQERFLYVSDTGRVTFKPSGMADYLGEKYAPVYNEGEEWGSLFYRYNPRGVWEILPKAELYNVSKRLLGMHADPRRIGNAVKLFEYGSWIPEKARTPNPMWLNLKNCMYNVATGETEPHHPRFYSKVQLPVSYNPAAKCKLWEDSLSLIFGDDLGKADTMQDFYGYCLYPKIIFPAALFQIGSGSNGKGTVQRVLEAMLGDSNVSHISLTRMQEKFGPVELKDKLLNTCGETASEPLDVTRFKEIAAADKVQAEKKYKDDVTFVPIAKHMISMNEFPGVKDKTPAFFRRIIVLEYHTNFEKDKDDKHLFDKLLGELDGIFLWALGGLKRVLETDSIFQPESVEQAKLRMRSAANNAVLFVEEECFVGKNPEGKPYRAFPPDLFKRYVKWCEESKIRPYGKQRFYEQLYLQFKVRRLRPNDETREMFEGIGLAEGEFKF